MLQGSSGMIGGDTWGDAERRTATGRRELILNIKGFEGPLDVLLALTKEQKVDISRISMLELADSYLAFIKEAEKLSIELAGDYLIMAADLTVLRSRLLYAAVRKMVHGDDDQEAAAVDELARLKKLQLQRLADIREAGASLMLRDQLGRNFFARGEPEMGGETTRTGIDRRLSLLDLVMTYLRVTEKSLAVAPLAVRRQIVMALAEGLKMLREVLAAKLGWHSLFDHIPENWRSSREKIRSAVAATFVASLEMSKRGEVVLRQNEPFGRIEVRTIGDEKKLGD